MLIMDKLNNSIRVALFAALFLLFLFSINFSAADDETETKPTSSIIDAAKRLYSTPTASDTDSDSDSGSRISYQPPNLDFRGGRGGGDDQVEDEVEAAPGIKDAVVKSLDESIATMEDSAKSAAKFVMDKTVNKLKTKLSQHDHQTEL